MLPTRIVLEPDNVIRVHLRDTQPVRTIHGLAILDVNDAGRWIRGIELLGSADFDLEKAVTPFNPERPRSNKSDGVTYDQEVDAAFICVAMKPPNHMLPETAAKYSRSITPQADFAFDSDGGLVWLQLSFRGANNSIADFVSLIDAPIEQSGSSATED